MGSVAPADTPQIIPFPYKKGDHGPSCSECNEVAFYQVYEKGDSPQLELDPLDRKKIILQMFSELQIAIEEGCIIQFSAKEIFPPTGPTITQYTFLVNKEMLINIIHSKNAGK